MIRSINVKNELVADTLGSCTNASELVEILVLFYIGILNEEYLQKYKELQETNARLRSQLNDL